MTTPDQDFGQPNHSDRTSRANHLGKTIQTYTLAAIFAWLGVFFLFFESPGFFALGFAAILFAENYLRNHYFLPYDSAWIWISGVMAVLGFLDLLGLPLVAFGLFAIAAKIILDLN